MLEENYCTDNFFKKMTDLESPKKNNDCYFYYYSTCSKGDNCGFRHEPSALGCETMCSFWKEGKCLNIHCNFRHMELRKNRKVIPCYWESQPGGCLKPHCPFMHQNARPLVSEENTLSKSDNALPENCTQAGNKNTSSVDSLVVNFEEESDSESAPTTSPIKSAIPKVKTLEEIKLEKIAAACAAYYSYPDDHISEAERPVPIGANDLRQRLVRVKSKQGVALQTTNRRKLSPNELAYILGDSTLNQTDPGDTSTDPLLPPYKKRKTTEAEDCFKVKTLEEIRAEKGRQETISTSSKGGERRKRKRNITPIRLYRNVLQSETRRNEIEEAEVSSTSNEEPVTLVTCLEEPADDKPLKPLRKLNLNKIKPSSGESEQIDTDRNTNEIESVDAVELNVVENIEESNITSCSSRDIAGTCKSDNVPKTEEDMTGNESLLLLDDNEQDINISAKTEDELLNEIDILLEA